MLLIRYSYQILKSVCFVVLLSSFGLSCVAGWSDGKENAPLGSKKCCNAAEPLSSQGIALTLQLKVNGKWSTWQPHYWLALVCMCLCVCACAIVDGTLRSILSMSGVILGMSLVVHADLRGFDTPSVRIFKRV